VLPETVQEIVKKNSKCHGNRKLQHFKRKCRARGLNEEEIIKLVDTRNHTISEQFQKQPMLNAQNKKSNKRKRRQCDRNSINKSMSQLSITQQTRKKLKNPSNQANLSVDINNNSQSSQSNSICLYRPSKYLKMSRKLLLQSLHLQLNCPLKKKKQQKFILSRLTILDQQFCLDQIHNLYQIYIDIGFQHQMWPVSDIITL